MVQPIRMLPTSDATLSNAAGRYGTSYRDRLSRQPAAMDSRPRALARYRTIIWKVTGMACTVMSY